LGFFLDSGYREDSRVVQICHVGQERSRPAARSHEPVHLELQAFRSPLSGEPARPQDHRASPMRVVIDQLAAVADASIVRE
jgi:hypothetical protein